MAKIDKDTVCTLTVTVSINDGVDRSEVALALPGCRAENVGSAFDAVKNALADAGRKIAIYDTVVLKQVGEVIITSVN